jgi:hypothetical protein
VNIRHGIGLATCVLALGATGALAQNVKITPLGSHPGELCARDRATIFEDPTGVRILYDAGQSVQGGDDARLGAVHVVLLTHAHGDHIGDMRLKAPGAGTCENPEVASAAPQSTTAEIVAAKNAAIVMVSPMAAFIGTKVAAIKGRPTTACPTTGGDVIVPPAAPCNARFVQAMRRRRSRSSPSRPRTTAPCHASCSAPTRARPSTPTT